MKAILLIIALTTVAHADIKDWDYSQSMSIYELYQQRNISGIKKFYAKHEQRQKWRNERRGFLIGGNAIEMDNKFSSNKSGS